MPSSGVLLCTKNWERVDWWKDGGSCDLEQGRVGYSGLITYVLESNPVLLKSSKCWLSPLWVMLTASTLVILTVSTLGDVDCLHSGDTDCLHSGWCWLPPLWWCWLPPLWWCWLPPLWWCWLPPFWWCWLPPLWVMLTASALGACLWHAALLCCQIQGVI